MIGRALASRGRWVFEPSKRGRRLPLAWPGSAAPEDGDYVIAEVDFEQARLVEVLGADDRPQWDDAVVASQYRLRQTFDPRAEREAESLAPPAKAEIQGRQDLRDRLVFTIDPEDARDHDDALGWRALGHGRHEVGIHIADVSHYVTPDSALDREAQARGLSCYLPGSVVPMLPEALSANLCSLRPDEDRLALSVFVELDERGGLHAVRFAETVIRSRHRLSYAQVQAAFDGDTSLPSPVLEALERLQSLARGLRAGASAARALDPARPRQLRPRNARVLPFHSTHPALPGPAQSPAGARMVARPPQRGVGSAGPRGPRRRLHGHRAERGRCRARGRARQGSP